LAIQAYKQSIELDENNFWAYAKLAKIYMQSRHKKTRSPDKALEFALKCNQMSHYQEPSLLKILARVYSENGKFEMALENSLLGLRLANNRGLRKDVSEFNRDIKAYHNKTNYNQLMRIPEAE